MRAFIVFSSLICFAMAADLINFNKKDYCGNGKDYRKQIKEDDVVNVAFREQSSNLGAFLTNLGGLKNECEMEFYTVTFTNKRLEVKFDTVKNFIKQDNVWIEFYDDDQVNPGKLLRRVSKVKPLLANETTVTTTGPFLTIRGYRDVKNAKNYDVDMTIRVVNSATSAKWSLMAVTVAAVTKFL